MSNHEPLTTPIAQGRTAEIFSWDAGHVLKLYRDWCPPDWVENKARTSMILQIGARAAGKQVKINPLILFFIRSYHQAYLHRYQSLTPDPSKQIRAGWR